MAININDLDNIEIVSRLENVFDKFVGDLFPEDYSGFFKCVDPSKGAVIGWSEKILLEPQCWR